jgi:ATP-dependent protease Clp ATPase subunit
MVGYNSETPKNKEELLGDVRPEDLVKYGLIPEFIGPSSGGFSIGRVDSK